MNKLKALNANDIDSIIFKRVKYFVLALHLPLQSLPVMEQTFRPRPFCNFLDFFAL